ncbi:MFS transporter [Opitutaceae bacterium TAV5]|nr:MFS transporter [Opitutaceae bacterium TAV5]
MPASSPALPARAWLVVGLLWVVGCLNYIDRIMLTTMRESVVDAIPMTDAQFGLLTSVFLWIYGCLSPFAGFLADRFSRTRIIIGSLIAWSCITWLTAHAQNFEQLLAARALMGISEAFYLPAALALIADYHRGSTRSLATGIHMTGIFVGQGLGGLGGVIAERHDWTTAFNLFGLAGVVYAVVLMIALRDPQPVASGTAGRSDASAPVSRPRLGKAFSSLFRLPAFWLAFGFWGLLGMANWCVLAWMPTYLGTRFNLGQGAAGFSATGYLQIAALVGVLFGGWWADRWSRHNERARILVPLIGMLVSAPAVFLVATTDTFSLAIAGLMIFGGTRCFADANMMPILCVVADQRYRATAYGILNFFACVIGGLSIYVGGAMRDAHVELDKVFLFAAFALAACAALLAFLKPRPGANE